MLVRWLSKWHKSRKTDHSVRNAVLHETANLRARYWNKHQWIIRQWSLQIQYRQTLTEILAANVQVTSTNSMVLKFQLLGTNVLNQKLLRSYSWQSDSITNEFQLIDLSTSEMTYMMSGGALNSTHSVKLIVLIAVSSKFHCQFIQKLCQSNRQEQFINFSQSNITTLATYSTAISNVSHTERYWPK